MAQQMQVRAKQAVQKLHLSRRSTQKAQDIEMSGKMEWNMSRCSLTIFKKIQGTG
jgi:hypothetical protein